MEKTYKLKTRWDDEEITVYLREEKYITGNVAYMLDDDEGQYADLTVNLPQYDLKKMSHLGNKLAFLDTNNFPCGERFVIANNLAEFTGEFGYSGFCKYPLYNFK